MKRFSGLMIIGVFCILMFAPMCFTYRFGQHPKTSEYQVMKKSLSITFPEPHIVRQGNYDLLELDNCSYTTDPGYPKLPIKTVTFKLSKNDTVIKTTVDVNEAKFAGSFSVLPAPSPIFAGSESGQQITEDPVIYKSHDLYPEQWYTSREANGIDAETNTRVKYVTLSIFPLRFQPDAKKVLRAQNVSITLEYVDAQLPASPPLLKNLIITSPTLETWADQLAEFKNNTGISSTVVTTTWIYSHYVGVDNQEKIRNCIKDFVATYGVIYVTIFGDADQVPVRYVYVYNGDNYDTPTDLYYADLDGTWDDNKNGLYGDPNDTVDGLPDVYLGRLPASTLLDAQTIVNKLILYYSVSDPSVSWARRIVLAAGTCSPDGYSDLDKNWSITLNEYIANEIVRDREITRLYDWTGGGNLSSSTLSSSIKNGAQFVNFDGHGDSGNLLLYWYFLIQHCFSISDVQALANVVAMPVVTSTGCNTARFDDTDCIGESFLLPHPGQAAGGAIAFFGPTRKSTFAAGDITGFGIDAIDWRIYDNYFRGFTQLGQMWEETIKDFIQAGGNSGDELSFMELEMLGDPSLEIPSAVPLSASVAPSSVVMNVGQSQLFTSNVSGCIPPPYSYYWYLCGAVSGNVATNPGFETGNFAGWNQEGPNDAAISINEHHTGSYCCSSPSDVYFNQYRIAQKVGIPSNIVTSVGCWCKNGVGMTGFDWLRVNYTDGSISSIGLVGGWSDWTYVTLSLTANKTVDSLILERNASIAAMIYVDDVQFIALNGAPVSGATGASWTFTPSSLGSYTVYLVATDAVGFTVTSNTVPVEVSGPIYIMSNGSIVPFSAPISSPDNVTYTFTGNIEYPIYYGVVVERSNIVIDGNGYTLQGNNSGNVYDQSFGLSLTDVSNVTIKNTNIKGFQNGILFGLSNNSMIVGNSITSNSQDGIHLYSSSNNTVAWNNATANNEDGINLWMCSNNTVNGNNASANSYGIYLYSSGNNTITGNNASANTYDGINLAFSSNNTITCNNATANGYRSVCLGSSSWNIITGNIITYNPFGLDFFNASNNIIYHNDFVGNNVQAIVDSTSLGNAWNDSYPSGGNYWSDYKGKDLYSGAYQNETGSDGIGDIPYAIDGSNIDHYPLGPFVLSVTISPSYTTLFAAQYQLFTSTVSGGTSPYTYQWYLNGMPVQTATSSSWTLTPTSGGSYAVYVKVNDSGGAQATSNFATVIAVGQGSSGGGFGGGRMHYIC